MEIGKVSEALDSLATPLVKLAALGVGLSALGYLAGWEYLRGYYTTLGASWVVGGFSTSEVIMVAMNNLAGIVVVMASLLYMYSEGTIGRLGLRKMVIRCGLISLLLGAVHFGVGAWWGDRYKSYWGSASLLFLVFALAAVAVSSVASIVEGHSTAAKEAIYLYGYLFLGALVGGIYSLGCWSAEGDLMHPRVVLPRVLGPTMKCEWYLLRNMGGGEVLLAHPEGSGKKPLLKVAMIGDGLMFAPSDFPCEQRPEPHSG